MTEYRSRKCGCPDYHVRKPLTWGGFKCRGIAHLCKGHCPLGKRISLVARACPRHPELCKSVHSMWIWPKSIPQHPLHPWSCTKTPWERIHIDYTEIDKQHFLVIVDVHSKWVEIFCTQLTNAEKTVNLLCHLWASYGFPKVLVSDNGPPLISKEFE